MPPLWYNRPLWLCSVVRSSDTWICIYIYTVCQWNCHCSMFYAYGYIYYIYSSPKCVGVQYFTYPFCVLCKIHIHTYICMHVHTHTHTHTNAHTHRLFQKLTLECVLSIAFGIALDIQNGKGGQIYKAVYDQFNLGEEMDLLWILFITGENSTFLTKVTNCTRLTYTHTQCTHTCI